MALHIASTKSPSKSISRAISREIVSIEISGPIISRIVLFNSSSYPGRKRPSMTALALPGITFALYPASSIVGLAVFCKVAPIILAVGPISARRGRKSDSSYFFPVACAIFEKRIFTVLVYLCGQSYRPIFATASEMDVSAFSSFIIDPWPARPCAVNLIQ